jgi:hypothetical protein
MAMLVNRLGAGVCTLHHRGVVQSTKEHVEDVSIPRIPKRWKNLRKKNGVFSIGMYGMGLYPMISYY